MQMYKIIESFSPSSVEERVNEMIEDGYEPCGSMQIFTKIEYRGSAPNYLCKYIQAMVHQSITVRN